MRKIRFLDGPRKGEVAEMHYADARRLVESGMVMWADRDLPDDPSTPIEAAVIEPPETTMMQHVIKKVKGRHR